MSSQLKTTALHPGFVTQVDAQIQDLLADEILIHAVEALWQTSPVLIFPRQVLDEADQVAFSGRFGECIEIHRKDNVSPYESKIVYFSTLRYADGRLVGAFANGEEADWHSDQTYTPNPATGALLYGVEVPRQGGHMYWSDQYGAYQLLDRELQQLIEGRIGTFRYTKLVNSSEIKGKEKEMSRLPDGRHKVVVTHPLTGRKALYVDPTRLVSIDGLSDADNERVLPLLFKAASDASLTYDHTVRSGDVMMWDNGCTLHKRDAISVTHPRLMKRTTFRLAPERHGLPSGCLQHAA